VNSGAVVISNISPEAPVNILIPAPLKICPLLKEETTTAIEPSL